MSIWTDNGFSQSPYDTDPVPPTAEGEKLLVGRELEVKILTNRITSSALHPTIEGDNGVGKTSLVSVVAYRLQQSFAAGGTGQALFPLSKTFQISPNASVDGLLRDVLYEVAHAFIKHHETLKLRGFSVPDVDSINRWLNSPAFNSGEIGAQVLGIGGNVARGSGPNTSSGFTESGFSATVSRWLRECFPSRQAGGFVCVIDNLELLETSQVARNLLEAMRDTVLSVPGLRWVLCGARGIVRTGASSPRLEGRLAEPMELKPVRDSDIELLVRRRIELYRVIDETVAPVGPEDFRFLYDLVNRNLRNSLKFCEDFSFWLYEQDGIGRNPDEYHRLLEVWLTEQADRALSATKLGERAWSVFDQLAKLGGGCSPSDYYRFDFNSSMAMRPHVKSLEDVNLVRSSIDETDKRRKTIMITPRGWLVRYAQTGYKLPDHDGG